MAVEHERDRIHVELVYAGVEGVHSTSLELDQGTTIGAAIQLSGFLEKYPEIDLEKNKVGIFNQLRQPEMPTRNHDRIEIYRPLPVGPKESRRRRAALRKQSDRRR